MSLPGIVVRNDSVCNDDAQSSLPAIKVVNDGTACNSDATSTKIPGIKVDSNCDECHSDNGDSTFTCDNIIIDNDYPYIGYVGTVHNYTWTVPDDWTYPADFIITIDNNYNKIDGVTDVTNLIALLNGLKLGTFSYTAGTILFSGNHECGEIIQINAAPAPPVGDSYINVDKTSPVAILDVLGVSMVDMSENHARSTDTTFINAISPINFLYGDAHGDDIAQWYRIDVTGNGDGYNISSSDATARNKTLATVLDGIGNVTYGYDFFDDYAATLQAAGITQAVISVNICRLLIQLIGRDDSNPIDPEDIDFSDFYNELEYMIDVLDSYGVSLRRVQLCLEMGISNQSDIILRADDYSIVASAIVDYMQANHAGVKISSDAYNVDDTSRLWDTYNSLNADLSVDSMRQYFHFVSSLTTYQMNRDRVNTYSDILDLFETEFPDKDCVFTQSAIKPGNPFRLKVGEGLIFSELYMNVINENISRSNLVTDFSYYNMSRMVSGTNTIYPVTYFLQLIHGMFQNSGRASCNLVNVPQSASLKYISVVNAGKAEVYILNPTSGGVTIPGMKVNGSAATVSVESYYGDPAASAASHYLVSSGSSVFLQPYSTTKITEL